MRSHLSLLLLLSAGACGDDPASGTNPDTAPVASVDRFSDSFGHLFKRSAPIFDPANVKPVVPAPNAAIDLDALFTVRALGPTGQPTTYYSLDILPRTPAKAYVLVQGSTEIAGQLPILEGLPGDAGYNDFARVTKVDVGEGYVANTLTSAASVRDAIDSGDATATLTEQIVNWAIVPAGTTAQKKFAGKTITGNRAWVNDQVAPFLRFEENLQPAAGGTVPVAEIVVIFENNMDPSAGFAQTQDGMTHNAINLIATDPGYSSLWNHSVGNKANFASVTDFPTALANVMAANVGVDVNCPEVR